MRDAPDHALNRMNALDLAAKADVGEERVIAALLHAVGLGMLRDDMERNVPELRRCSLRQQKPEDPESARSIIALSAPRAMRRRSTIWSR